MDLRRSSRLCQSGYYNMEGGTSVSYKETLPATTRGKSRRPDRRMRVPDAAVASPSSTSKARRVTWNNNIDRTDSVDSTSSADSTTHFKVYRLSTKVHASNTSNSSNSSRSRTFIRYLLWLLFALCLVTPVVYALTVYWGQSRPLYSPVPPVPHIQDRFDELQQQDELLRLQHLHKPPLGDTMTNFALESNGARVLVEHSSETFHHRSRCVILWFQISCRITEVFKQPNALAQGRPCPGRCWPFSGDRGHMVIRLSHPVTISHVTLGHIAKDQIPTGTITSAPKSFAVYGMMSADDEGTLLGNFVYDQDGKPVQTFTLPDQAKGVFSHVKLQVESNWGHLQYTCLYDFRVHGTTSEQTLPTGS